VCSACVCLVCLCLWVSALSDSHVDEDMVMKYVGGCLRVCVRVWCVCGVCVECLSLSLSLSRALSLSLSRAFSLSLSLVSDWWSWE